MYSPGTNSASPAAPDDNAPNAAPVSTSPKGEVPPKAAEGAPAFPTASPSEPSPSPALSSSPPFATHHSPLTSSSSNPKSPIQNPKSSSPLPLLDDSILLIEAAAGILDAPQIAAKHNIELKLFLDWYSAPQTLTRITAILISREHIRQRKYEVLQDEATETLRDLHCKAGLNNDPVERRRSASALLRFTTTVPAARSSPSRLFAAMGTGAHAHASSSRARGGAGLSLSRIPGHYRTRSRTVRTAPILHEAPAILGPPTEPQVDADPQMITCMLLARLQDPDNPCDGDGLRTLYNFFTPAWQRAVGAKSADDFACTECSNYHTLLAHSSAVLRPTEFPPPHAPRGSPILRVVQPFEFRGIDGETDFAEFHFIRESASHPWLIDNIETLNTREGQQNNTRDDDNTPGGHHDPPDDTDG